ncbi:MAG TPA: SRPBCC family protein [Pirellulales bacterium]|nr:SRPBCC family protein [Pirellulales bacterium]
MATAEVKSHDSRWAMMHEAAQGEAQPVNVGPAERFASLLAGGAMALLGLRRGTLGGLTTALVGGSLVYRGATGHCSGYAALGINTARRRSPQAAVGARQGVKVERDITIFREPAALYSFWRNFENLPRVMSHLDSVRCEDPHRSHWIARGPLGRRVEWDAEVINERENELIAWRSLEGSDIDTAGSIHFAPAPGERGTEVKVVLKYDVPAGKAGAAIAWLCGEAPGQQVQEDLRRFKQIMEAGAVPTIEGQPMGRCR